jgi:transposase InsO family protein
VHCHPNARVTPRRRAEVFEAVEAGMTVVAACLAYRVSRRWYYRWLPRWQAHRRAGMLDRSSRPGRSPQLLCRAQEEQIVLLRKQTGWGPDRIASLTGVPRSTVHRVIRRRGLQAPPPIREPIQRYEFAEPGGLVHIDTKKLARIVRGPGHRIHGDRRRSHSGGGYEVLHVAVDDATRLVYCEVLADERGRTAALFLIRALRWFRERGIVVRRLLTDNGGLYKSKAWRRVCRVATVRHRFTRPYRPQTNLKAERWIRTVLGECLYLRPFGSCDERRAGLAAWLQWYNRHRPHRALQGRSPERHLSALRAA